MKSLRRTAVVLAVALYATSLPTSTAGGADLLTAVAPTPALPRALPAPMTTTPPSARRLPHDHLEIGARDLLRTDGTLTWAPSTGVPFDSVYQYVSGTGPGTPGDYRPSTVVAFAQAARAMGAVPVVSYFRVNGNAWGPLSRPAACQGTCTSGDSAKRNLDHLGDPSFMQHYFVGLVDVLRALDSGYDGQLVLHLEPDLSGYGQMLSNDRTRCGSACLAGVAPDDPAGVRAAVAATRLTGLERFPDTLQGFYLAVLRMRDLYAPRVSLAYHVSGWATADVFRTSGTDDPTLDINQGTVPVDTDALAARVARFAALGGASRTATTALPGPAVSRYDLLYNDVLDHDAAYAELVGRNPHYWWDTENVDLPSFHRWQQWVRGITSRTGQPLTVWQVPLGNTVFRVQDNSFGHYQDNRAQYFFDHLEELAGAGITGIVFGGGNADSTSSSDRQLDAPDNTSVVCTHRGSHSRTLRCPWRDATVRDDDGGYLRERAAAYLARPLALR